jgi:hypothetical protein
MHLKIFEYDVLGEYLAKNIFFHLLKLCRFGGGRMGGGETIEEGGYLPFFGLFLRRRRVSRRLS